MFTQPLFIIGMPGSGKSTLGRLLAKRLQLRFTDTDQLIEDQTGKTVAQLFGRFGEAHFRELERDLLAQLGAEAGVIATGGGMPCFFDNIRVMKEKGVVLFLDASLDTLQQRVLRQAGTRPLFGETDAAALLAQLAEKYRLRLPFYEQAHVRYVTDKAVVSEAWRLLNGFLGK